ncbi:phospholipase D-like domain-containing protein [soil metagenome]
MKRAVLIFLAVAGGLSIAWAVYVLVVPEPEDILPEILSQPGSMDASEMIVTLGANLGAPVVGGNRAELLVNGEEIFPPMLEAIRTAEQSISFLTYIYWKGEIAEQFAAELAAASRRGVEVRVLLDAFGGYKMDPALVAEMGRAGCRVAWFHPLHWYTLRRFNNRTHRKVMVVDGRIGFTGGVGIASEWTGDAEEPGHWRDDHFRVEGPIVRYLQGSFAQDWRAATGEVLTGPRLFPELEAAGSAGMVPVLEAPGASLSQIAFLYWLSIAGAARQIHISTPYFVPDPNLAEAMREAARRGVEVRLLVPGERNDASVVRYASRTYYLDLLRAGVEIYEFEPTMYHVKAVTVDDAWAIIGSPNFDNRSFELNYEIALAVSDSDLVDSLEASFERDLSRSRRITLADVEGWSFAERARDQLARLLRDQL